MIPILNSSQIRDVDEYTIKNTPISSIDLMEIAAQGCVNWILKRLHKSKKIIIFIFSVEWETMVEMD